MFVYAEGRDHPYRGPCQSVIELIGSGELDAGISVALLEEYAHVRIRRGIDRAEVARRTARIAQLCEVHEFQRGDWPVMLELLVAHPRLDVRDALYAATALNRELQLIVSADRDFDAIAGLERVDPADAERLRELSDG